ncbi:MAG: hypothetical protein IPM96_17880 [Ignavibacteria bacterium]|nr:hypothetical protein [Ignavibacteria bacterium]
MIRYTSSGNLVSHEHIDMPADFNRAFPRKFEIRGSDMYIFCTAVNTSFNYDVLGFKCNILGDTLWTWKTYLIILFTKLPVE